MQSLWSKSAVRVTATKGQEQDVAIARQPIVDEKQAVVGYELFERPRAATNDDALLFDALAHADTDGIAGSKTVFVRCTFENIADGCLDMLDAQNVVLEIPTTQPLLFVHDEATRLMALHRARNNGFRLAFDQSVLKPEHADWLPLASFIKLDLEVMPAAQIEPAVRLARSLCKADVVANQVGTREQYELLKSLGIRLFQGNWFEQPVPIQQPSVRASQATIVQLLNLVRQDAELSEIEELLKKDPALAFKLLRFINSSAFGLQVEITSFRHAVMVLGLNQLFRWATLLMTSVRPGGAAPAAGTAAVVRGRLMELLAKELMAGENVDNAFVTGVFSMLDTLVGLPLKQAVASINLPQPVVDALLSNEGELAPLLALARACESSDDVVFGKVAEALQLSSQQVNWAHLQALIWADRLQG